MQLHCREIQLVPVLWQGNRKYYESGHLTSRGCAVNEKLRLLRVKKLGKKWTVVSVSPLELSAVIPTFQEPGRLSHADAKALFLRGVSQMSVATTHVYFACLCLCVRVSVHNVKHWLVPDKHKRALLALSVMCPFFFFSSYSPQNPFCPQLWRIAIYLFVSIKVGH